MHITNISALNVKGESFDHSLARTTLFYGENMSGKTARLDAVRIGLLGYLPRLGVQPAATFKLSGHPSKMSVALTMDDASVISWLWTMERETVKRSGPVKPPAIPEILLDASGFFALKTSNKRIEYVFENVATSALLSPDKLMADLKNLKIEPMTEVTQGLLSSLVAEIDDSVHTWRLIHQEDTSKTFQGWLDSEMEKISELLKKEKQNVDRMAKAVQAAVQLSKTATRDLATLESEARRLREEISTIDGAIAKQNERRSVASRAARRRTELETLLAQPFDPSATAEVETELRDTHQRLLVEKNRLESDIKTTKDSLARLQSLAAEHRVRTEEIARIESQTAVLDSILIRREERGISVSSYKSRTDELVARVADMKTTLRDLHRDVEGIEAQKNDGVKRIALLRTTHSCPTCGTSGSGLDAAISSLEDAMNQAFDLCHPPAERALTDATQSLHVETVILDASRKNDATIAEWKNEIASLDRDIAKLSALKARADALKQNTSATTPEEIHEFQAKVTQFAELLTNCIRAEQRAGLGVRDIQTKLKVCQSRKEWESELSALPTLSVEDSDTGSEVRKNDLQRRFEEVNLEIKRAVVERQEEIARKRSEAELVVSQTRASMLKAVVEKVKEFRASLVDSVFGSLMAGINRVVHPVLGKPLYYEDGDLFFRSESARKIPCEMFSGTEDAVVQAAVCLAMATSSQIKLVVFDELGRISAARKPVLIQTVQQLISENVIDQFIGVDVDASPYRSFLENGSFALIHVT